MNALALATSSPAASAVSLGPLAMAVEAQPVATLTVGASLVGALLAGGAAYLVARVSKSRSPLAWTGAAAASAALIAGAEGYQQGQQLSEWLAAHA